MTRLSLLSAALRRSLDQRSTLKVIAGLMNFDAVEDTEVEVGEKPRGISWAEEWRCDQSDQGVVSDSSTRNNG